MNGVARELWRDFVGRSSPDALDVFLTIRERVEFFGKVAAALPDRRTSVRAALTDQDLRELAAEVLYQSRGEKIPEGEWERDG